MDYKAIEQIIKTAGESGLSFLEIETEGIRITMKKGGEQPVLVKEQVKTTTEDTNGNCQEEKAISIEKPAEVSAPVKPVEDANLITVTSPIVGTFYGSSGPDSEPFVQVGSKVKKGQTLCIIEAMKLMNEIDAEVDGEIVEILVENEQMVEYGQELFKIR